jgi:hypothetical protein
MKEMDQTAIFLPMCALAAWTFAVLLLIALARFRAAARGSVNAGDFRYGESARAASCWRCCGCASRPGFSRAG